MELVIVRRKVLVDRRRVRQVIKPQPIENGDTLLLKRHSILMQHQITLLHLPRLQTALQEVLIHL